MRFPSYLIRNRFGIFYFRVVFPAEVCAILNRKETRKSLKTYDRKIALSMSLEFQKINCEIFKKIRLTKMNWIEAKKLFDDVAEKLFEKYVKRVEEVGFDFEDPDALIKVMPEARLFLSPTNANGEWDSWCADTQELITSADFEANL